MSNTSHLKSFYYCENGEITFSTLDTIKTAKILESGSYRIEYDNNYRNPRIIIKADTNTEAVTTFDFQHKKDIDNLIEAFFNSKIQNKVKKLNIYHKIGLLLHGKEGTGKTSILRHFIYKIITAQQAIAFYITGTDDMDKMWDFISEIRKIQNNPIIVIWDEFDRFVGPNAQQSKKNESLIKQLMDGQLSINNCIFFATTNYIDEIPHTLKNRPSRFKYVYDIGGIDDVTAIHAIIKNMIGDQCTDEQMKKYSEELKGNTVDEIKQFCLDKIMELGITKQSSSKKIGFK